MENRVQTTVSMPEDIVTVASNFAVTRHCSFDELVEQALRAFVGLEADCDPAFEANRQEARDMGFTPEEYSVYAVKQVRAELRAERQQAAAA